MTALEVLRNSSFGQRTAEEEREHLRAYFVETEQWNQVFIGEVDIIYGPKGSGKSAIYSLISLSTNELFDRNIIVVPGENPQGAPAFKDIGDDPPYNEFEFVNLWKLYILTLCGQAIKDYGLTGSKCIALLSALEEAELIPSSFSLAKALRYAFDYVRSFTRPKALESVRCEHSVDRSSASHSDRLRSPPPYSECHLRSAAESGRRPPRVTDARPPRRLGWALP